MPITRYAATTDAEAIARIYSEGIADRIATFEIRPRSAADILVWFDGTHPVVVVEDDRGAVIAFAASSLYRDRDCYSGIAEFSVYVARAQRGKGAGHMALAALIEAAAAAGFWKLVSRIFPENAASLALMARLGFRQVGIYHRHAQLDGEWRDCVIVERLLAEPSTASHASSEPLSVSPE